MSDFWSQVYLGITVLLALVLIPTALLITRLGKLGSLGRSINLIVLVLFALAVAVWYGDRVRVGFYCLPWECLSQGPPIEALLLDDKDMRTDGQFTFRTGTYIADEGAPLAVSRTFFALNTDQTQELVLSQFIHQYRSQRGASFQFGSLQHQIPLHYDSGIAQPLSIPRAKNRATNYSVECQPDIQTSTHYWCYYFAQYGGYLVTLEMYIDGTVLSRDDFVRLISVIDEKMTQGPA